MAMSGWDVATSIGTIAGAVATTAAVVAALVVAAKDRRAADAAQRVLLESAAARQAREHHVDLLLRIAQEVAQMGGYGVGSPQYSASAVIGRSLTLALPDITRTPALRGLMLPEQGFPDLSTVSDIHGESASPSAQFAAKEIASELSRLSQHGR